MTHTTASIPVDLKSPGQVLACMGFLEAADVLLGGVEAHFDWSDAQTTFVLRADGDRNPFEVVLEFLSRARISELTPIGYVEGGAADGDDSEEEDAPPTEHEDSVEPDDDDSGEVQGRVMTLAFPSGEGDRNALPVRLVHDGRYLTVSHWADGSSRDDFKLYSGNRSANRIANQMLQGVRAKPKNNQSIGDLKNQGLQQLWQEQREALLKAPFDVVTPMGGSFNFDPRGAWTAIDAGYSPNTQKDGIAASPAVEILAAIGLEHARPDQYETRKVRYAVWGHPLPPMLARAALAGADLKLPLRRFEFELDLSGKNKVTTFAQEEAPP
ncbi:MAG: type I-U CRISPR-associated protein Cas8c [Planctomycetota bacterium]